MAGLRSVLRRSGDGDAAVVPPCFPSACANGSLAASNGANRARLSFGGRIRTQARGWFSPAFLPHFQPVCGLSGAAGYSSRSSPLVRMSANSIATGGHESASIGVSGCRSNYAPGDVRDSDTPALPTPILSRARSMTPAMASSAEFPAPEATNRLSDRSTAVQTSPQLLRVASASISIPPRVSALDWYGTMGAFSFVREILAERTCARANWRERGRFGILSFPFVGG